MSYKHGPILAVEKESIRKRHKKTYNLTDGTEVFATKEMTDAELHEANEVALRHTGGNVSWEAAQ